jgi:transmembrane sensor
MEKGYIEALLRSYINREINDADLEELKRLFTSEADKDAIVYTLQALMERHSEGYAFDPVAWEEMRKTILSVDRVDLKQIEQVPIHRSLHRVHFLKTAWLRYAAAILILFSVGTYLYINHQQEKPSVTTTNSPVPVQNDVAPGGNKAILTLADGSKINLDSAASGQVAREQNATITKTAEGKIVYMSDEKLGNRILYNTMATPRGGQYQLSLPDGSQVWLNAESSITYPTMFAETERERRVTITGEAYFEVAKNKSKPFRVDIGTATIEVLGTHFNVNAYKEEATTNTTLLEGSVRVSLSALRSPLSNSVHTSLTLKPGQQGQLNPRTEKLSLAVNPDVEQAVAWKNGTFNFNKVTLPEAMRQIARWYDVQVIYEGGKIPDMRFVGEMGRDLNLSQVLKGLEALGVRFTIEGKKLTVKSSSRES